MNDSELACLFSNTLPNTLDTTLVAFTEPPEPPDSFVITGDIPAMWLRDATNQVLPYLRFVKQDPRLARMLSGLIARQTAQVLADPYANAHTQHAYETSPNALDATSSPGFGPSRRAGMRPGIFERKYELDSLMAFLKLSRSYYTATRDRSPFGAQWRSAVALVRAVVRGLQASSTEEARLPGGPAYSFARSSTAPTDTLLHGVGEPAARTGMSRSMFRPSDDACALPFLVPANAMAVVELRHTATLLRELDNLTAASANPADPANPATSTTPDTAGAAGAVGTMYVAGATGLKPASSGADPAADLAADPTADLAADLAADLLDLAAEIDDGITRHAVMQSASSAAEIDDLEAEISAISPQGSTRHAACAECYAGSPQKGHRKEGALVRTTTVYAYEVDGFGNSKFMDDANVPSLLSLPYLGYCARDEPTYTRTRRRLLSNVTNPWYFSGRAASGIGGPHVGLDAIWPMSIIMRALTSTDDDEIALCLKQLKTAAAGTGLMHESFHKDDPASFTRPWFAWANSLFGELILQLAEERPHLLGMPRLARSKVPPPTSAAAA